MAVSQFLEDLVSHLPALHLLQQMGYSYLTPGEALELRDGKRSRVVLETVLEEQLRKLNQIEFKGETHAFSDANIRNAIDAMVNVPFDGVVKTNEQVFDLLTLGKSLEQTIAGNKKSFTLQFIDWENPANNVYHVADEFEVERTRSHKIRRPDLVLFVNGIPLVVIECKRPDLKNACEEGVSQQIGHQRKAEIPHLFVYSQLLLSVCQNFGKFGTAGTPTKFWALWKEENAEYMDAVIHKLINTPLTDQQEQRIYSSRQPHVAARMKELSLAGERIPSPQDRFLYWLLRPTRLLEMAYQFTVFDKNVKKVARYQQYFAIAETMARVTKVKGDEKRTGGVIWHTTGSGKSLTMVMLAKALSLEPTVKNPRVVIVTDRVDLDTQIYNTFRACGKSVVKARNAAHLVELASQGKVDIITTLLHKFKTALNKHKLRIESNNIFVLVDEAHRSHSTTHQGKPSTPLHVQMQRVFPNACYLGFTGTPLLKSEKSTANQFGGFIHSYPMRKAVEDKAVTPILYEGRMSELHGDEKALDKWFDRITGDLSDQQKVDLKKRFRREEELTKTSERLYEIAFDIATHFCANFKRTKMKGQFAVSSKAMALKYHKLFQEIGQAHPDRKVTTRVVVSPPDTREDNETIEETDVPEMQKFWTEMMAEYGSEKDYLKTIIEDFESKPEPEIIICVDKLLTGFDAPCNTVLYIDKRLRDHNILQAIARVNRLFEGKEFGLVIDYRGIFGALDEAVKKYDALDGFDEEDIEGTFTDVQEEIGKLKERHANVVAVFNGVSNRHDPEAMQQWLRPDDVRQDFYDSLNLFARTLQIALGNARFHETTPAETVQRYLDDVKYFRDLRAAVKQRYNEAIDYKEYEAQIRNMVDKHVGADEVQRIIEPVNIFEVDNLDEELADIDGAAAKADFIASRVKKTCTEKMEEDPILFQKLSKVIDDAIQAYIAKRLSEEEYLQQMLEAWNETKQQGSSDLPSGLQGHPDAKAYYRLFLEGLQDVDGESSQHDLNDICSEAALKAKKIIDDRKIRDWVTNQDVVNSMVNELDDMMFAVKGRYDLPLSHQQIDEILENVMRVAKRRDGKQ